MSFNDQLFIFGALIVGAVVAVVLTLFIASALGLVKLAPKNAAIDTGALERARARIPQFAELPEVEQVRILRSSVRHPVLWAGGSAIIAAFLWLAVSNPQFLDLINSSRRMATLIGVALLVAILGLGFVAREALVRRMVRRFLSSKGADKGR